MVHHTEWDREYDMRYGFYQQDLAEMKQIVREAPTMGSSKNAHVLTDAELIKKASQHTVYGGPPKSDKHDKHTNILICVSIVALVLMLMSCMGAATYYRRKLPSLRSRRSRR